MMFGKGHFAVLVPSFKGLNAANGLEAIRQKTGNSPQHCFKGTAFILISAEIKTVRTRRKTPSGV